MKKRGGKRKLEIMISHKSSKPIYEQIGSQIKDMILTGELKSGDMITSVRSLAKELGIGVLTVQKAYDRLQKEGIIETVVGKGTYITNHNSGGLEDQRNQLLEDKAMELIALAKKYSIEQDSVIALIKLLFDESQID
ncbi:GntR family transcriptional regulator [uncultured Robinsoniella sp.]|uniref:GntR family transcriptional regulator n=2 Tax=uncultured Robinsoniella sp. TaxID=904190 RepID=UPI00374EAFC7